MGSSRSSAKKKGLKGRRLTSFPAVKISTSRNSKLLRDLGLLEGLTHDSQTREGYGIQALGKPRG